MHTFPGWAIESATKRFQRFIGSVWVYSIVTTNMSMLFHILAQRLNWFRILTKADPRLLIESKTFDASDWKKNLDRTSEWRKLLEQQDLIGMPRANIFKLLGDGENRPNWICYPLATDSFCGNASTGVLLEFKDDRLKRWCISALMSDKVLDR